MTTKDEGSNDNFWKEIPDDVVDVMIEAKDEAFKKIPIYKNLLEHLVKCLDEDFAKLFNTEKRRVFSRDLFDAPKIILDDEDTDITMIKKTPHSVFEHCKRLCMTDADGVWKANRLIDDLESIVVNWASECSNQLRIHYPHWKEWDFIYTIQLFEYWQEYGGK